MCSNTGTPNNHHFPFGTNGKVVVLGVPILKHLSVLYFSESRCALDLNNDIEHALHIVLKFTGIKLEGN